MSFWDKLGKAAEKVWLRAEENAARRQQQEARMLHERRDSPSYQHGRDDIKTAIVLSAPGSHEERAGRPAAGQTGRTLNRTLKALHEADPKRFPSASKDDYRIVNASDEIHYKRKTGRTEARGSSLDAPANKARLRDSLKGKSTIVALGSKAQATLASAGVKATHTGSHPSMQNINRNYAAKGRTGAERSEERISKFAAEVADSGRKRSRKREER